MSYKAGLPYIYKPHEVPCEDTMRLAPDELKKPVKDRVLKAFAKRTIKDVDEKATFNFVPGHGTAYWKNNPTGSLHEICMHEGIMATVSSFGCGDPIKGTWKSISPAETPTHLGISNAREYLANVSKPALYPVRTQEHEICHALYTSWDIKRLMVTDPKAGGYDGNLANLFEDARIEDLFRQRRPGKKTLDREGNEITIPSKADGGTYGIRKFDWWRWTGAMLDTPRHVFMAFTMAENIKEILEAIFAAFETQHGSQLGSDRIDERWDSKYLGRCTTIQDVYEFYKRCTFHGHGKGTINVGWKISNKQRHDKVATAHDLHQMMCEFQQIWPSNPSESGKGGNGRPGGRNGDMGEKATQEGHAPHDPNAESESESEEPEEKKGGEEEVVHDSAGETGTDKRIKGEDFNIHVQDEEPPEEEQAVDPRGDIPKSHDLPTQYFKREVIEHLEGIINKPWMEKTKRLLDISDES